MASGISFSHLPRDVLSDIEFKSGNPDIFPLISKNCYSVSRITIPKFFASLQKFVLERKIPGFKNWNLPINGTSLDHSSKLLWVKAFYQSLKMQVLQTPQGKSFYTATLNQYQSKLGLARLEKLVDYLVNFKAINFVAFFKKIPSLSAMVIGIEKSTTIILEQVKKIKEAIAENPLPVKRIVNFSLRCKFPDGILPSTIGLFSNLQILDLSSNRLRSLPRAIGNCSNLYNLDLSINLIETLPAEIGNCKQLTMLDLKSNSLITLPVEIAKLVNLQQLDIKLNPSLTISDELSSILKRLEKKNLMVIR